jgi:hypothetical protein
MVMHLALLTQQISAAVLASVVAIHIAFPAKYLEVTPLHGWSARRLFAAKTIYVSQQLLRTLLSLGLAPPVIILLPSWLLACALTPDLAVVVPTLHLT